MSDLSNPFNIQIETPPFSVFEVLRKIERGHIELNPDFQRNFVWDTVRQSRLIESLILKIPLPTFYLDATNEARWQVVDGLQRLSTLYAFCKKQSLRLQGLEYLHELTGSSFAELPEEMQRTIEDTALTLIAVKPGTARDVKFMIFRRINTSGLHLTEQEIRHAIFEGPARGFLQELATSPTFLQATHGQIDAQRMEDRECVLRYLAFRLNPYDNIEQLDTMLNQTMEELNQMSPIALEEHANAFYASMAKAQQLFEELAFRELNELSETGPFRKGLFEAWSVSLHRYPAKALAAEQTRQAIQRASLAAMNTDPRFLAAIQPGADDRQSIITRFSTVEQILRSTLR